MVTQSPHRPVLSEFVCPRCLFFCDYQPTNIPPNHPMRLECGGGEKWSVIDGDTLCCWAFESLSVGRLCTLSCLFDTGEKGKSGVERSGDPLNEER